MIKKLILALAVAGAASLPIADVAQAAVSDGVVSGASQPAQIAPIEKTQFFFGGYRYCWYPGGWRGPGWYYCGFPWRYGYGWGGGYGWRGWGGGRGWRGGGRWHGGGGHFHGGGGHGHFHH
jgi:hypothetical protein